MERLTEDMIISVISRLSIKCVLRCRCVCKSWGATVSSPSFARAHYERASTLNPITNYIITYFKFSHDNLLYFVEDDREDQEPFTTTNDQEEPEKETFTLSIVKPLNFPFLLTDYCSTQDKRSILMGACHGFLCFSTIDVLLGGGCPTNPSYLFNPVNGEHVLLPDFEEACFIIPAYGFGFDASSQEYKVVLVYLNAKSREKDLVQVHTVGSDHWRRIDNVPQFLTDDSLEVETSLPLPFNGSIHWILLNSVEDGHKRAYILSFQLNTEEFGFIPMPQPLQVMGTSFRGGSMEYALNLCGGCLSIICSPETHSVDIWVMKNYNVKESWIKQYSIRLHYSEFFFPEPLGFRKNGELMLSLGNKKLASYDTDKHRYKIFKLDGELQELDLIVPFPFVGSFISLKSAHGGKLADNKVIVTSGFRNPIRRQQWTGILENGSYRVNGFWRKMKDVFSFLVW